MRQTFFLHVACLLSPLISVRHSLSVSVCVCVCVGTKTQKGHKVSVPFLRADAWFKKILSFESSQGV